MKIPFNTPVRKWCVVAVAMVLSIAYVGFAASQFAASELASPGWAAWLDSGNVASLITSWLGGGPTEGRSDRARLRSLKWATRLDPGNAEFRNALGRYYDLGSRDQASALPHYLAAVQLNPHSANYWFDLANAYLVLGDTSHQVEALEQAIHADSMTPNVAWEAANLYIVQGENEKALREFEVVIANDPSLGDRALQYAWRIQPDVDSLLRVLPARSAAYASFLNLLEAKQETAGTIKTWNALMQTRQPFEQRQAWDYIRYLVQHKEVDQAVLVWQQAVNRFNLSSYLPSSANLVVNGNFSRTVLNAGFDWQYQKQPGVSLTLDPTDFHAGQRSLLVTFDGPGIEEAGIYQLVAVQPNATYDFSAYYKNGDNTEGAGAPHFMIQDMYTQTIYYQSEELRDSGFWKSADGEFTTGPDCKLVVLHIRRLPAGSPIRGKLWVDDFHITKKSS